MPLSDWSKVISVSVVPVVIISACGLLCLAFYNRLAAVVSRLRGFQRERLREQELIQKAVGNGAEGAHRRRLLEMLEAQTAHVTHRAKLLRWTLFFLLLTIVYLITCSMALGLSMIVPLAMYAAVPIFLLGMLSMLTSIIIAMLELRAALQPVELESRFVSDMVGEIAAAETDESA